MKRPIGINLLTALHLILFGGFLYFFIFLIPVVYDSSMSIGYEKVIVAINCVINGIAFFGLLSKSKAGWFCSILYFILITFNNVTKIISSISLSWINFIVILICIIVFLYLFDDIVLEYFSFKFRFKFLKINFKALKKFFSNKESIFIGIIFIHFIYLYFNIRMGWNKFGYAFGLNEIPEMYDKMWLLVTTWITVLFIFLNIVAAIGIILKRVWGILLSAVCLVYMIGDYIFVDFIFKILTGYEISEVLPTLVICLLGVGAIVWLISFLLKHSILKNHYDDKKSSMVLLIFSIIIGLAFVMVDVVRLGLAISKIS